MLFINHSASASSPLLAVRYRLYGKWFTLENNMDFETSTGVRQFWLSTDENISYTKDFLLG